MASKLFFTPIPEFPLCYTTISKCPERIQFHPLPPLAISSGYYYFKVLSTSKRLSSSSLSSCSSSSSSSSSSSLAVHAVKEEVIQSPNSETTHDSKNVSPSSSKLVLVVGGSGGVRQLVVASLLDRNIKSRLLLRDPEKVIALFGKQKEEALQVIKGDTRNPDDLDPSIFEGVKHVICCTGTTAFPSKRWDGDNTPERVGQKFSPCD